MLLSVLDRKWREHLYEMDYLKEGIGLRAMAQRDPLVEYQREGYDMFAAMLDGLKEESVGFLFNLQVEAAAQPTPQPAGLPVDPGLRSPVGGSAGNGGRTVAPAPAPLPTEEAAAERAAAPAPAASGPAAPAAPAAPTALRAKGLDEEEEPSRLTFTGPDEGGRASVRQPAEGAAAAASGASGTRRERREAARAQAKPQRKSPKSKRRK